MHEFAEEYVANLKPRDERYDTRLGDDFYVATFPNGIKTWVHVFQVNEYTRRQTLGVYPEMPLGQALESLYAARRTRAVEADLAEKGLDGSQLRQAENSPIDLTAKIRVPQIKLPNINRRFLAGVATGAVVSTATVVAAWMFLGPTVGNNALPRSATTDVPVASVAAATVVEVLPAEETLAQTTSTLQTTATVYPDPPAIIAPSATGQTVAEQEPRPTANTDSKATEEQSPPAKLSASQLALRQLQTDMAGTLAWAQLTSDIQDGKPVDQLSWVIELDQSPRRVFYFVRVRGLAGSTVTYRWSHQGKVLKEDAVRVGQGWHSPAYSGITLTPERLGRWQVEVYGPDGVSLGSEEFETRLTKGPQLSQR